MFFHLAHVGSKKTLLNKKPGFLRVKYDKGKTLKDNGPH